jgi:hypothetical protein
MTSATIESDRARQRLEQERQSQQTLDDLPQRLGVLEGMKPSIDARAADLPAPQPHDSGNRRRLHGGSSEADGAEATGVGDSGPPAGGV